MSLWRDSWLSMVVLSRTLMTLIFMTYAACMPVLIDAWQMTAAEAGTIAGGFHFGYLISLTLFSWLADRVGGRNVFLVSASLSAVSAIAFALFAQSYLTGLVLFTLVALSQGGTYYPAIMIISDRYPPEERGRAMGWLIASTSIGYALSLVLSGQMLAFGGYQLAFMVTAGGTVIGAGLALFAMGRTANVIHPRQHDHDFRREIIRNRPATRLIAGYTFHNWELLGMWAWMPAFLAAAIAGAGISAGAAVTSGAYIAAAFHAIGFVAASSMGQLSDRYGRRRLLICLAAVSTVCSFAMGWTFTWPIVLIFIIGAVYAFTALGDSPVLSTALTEAVHPAYLGSTLAVRGVIGFGAGVVAPPVFGLVLDLADADASPVLAWGSAFAVLGIGGLLATVVAFGVAPGKPKVVQSAESTR